MLKYTHICIYIYYILSIYCISLYIMYMVFENPHPGCYLDELCMFFRYIYIYIPIRKTCLVVY